MSTEGGGVLRTFGELNLSRNHKTCNQMVSGHIVTRKKPHLLFLRDKKKTWLRDELICTCLVGERTPHHRNSFDVYSPSFKSV